MLRRILSGWPIVYPALVFGMLGFNPNEMVVEDQVAIIGDLTALGYHSRMRAYPYRHAHLMFFWHREDEWPEDVQDRMPYRGIPLVPDPELLIDFKD